jgi:serine/threonine-protein phosphatase 2A activator
MSSTTPTAPTLQTLDTKEGHGFIVPVKRIHDGDDVTFFLASKAYADIMTFIFQLNTSMLPRRIREDGQTTERVKEWTLHDKDVPDPPVVQALGKLLEALTAIIDEAPPDPGPRRFGNVSFRVWYDIVRERVPALLDQYLPSNVLAVKTTTEVSAKAELEAYLIGSFGSSQRLDYGTGHELSFLAFLGCLWKLGAFPKSEDGDQERGIVLGVIEPYLVLIRRLILTYTLEPAGSHGVWGLDDHSFAPYIFGSAQFSPPIVTPADVVTEGSLATAPNPADVAKAPAVARERGRNMYFSAIGFIYDVKKGPFWEHSPILYDISGVKAGWAKINKARNHPFLCYYSLSHYLSLPFRDVNNIKKQGMIKMYNAEVLAKFPVVQHFPFGSLFAWEKDPNAQAIQASVHTSNQPKSATPSSTAPTARPQPQQQPLRDPGGMPATAAPWANSRSAPPGPATRAPWASNSPAPPVPSGPDQPTRAPWASSTPAPPPPGGGTTAPWARGREG